MPHHHVGALAVFRCDIAADFEKRIGIAFLVGGIRFPLPGNMTSVAIIVGLRVADVTIQAFLRVRGFFTRPVISMINVHQFLTVLVAAVPAEMTIGTAGSNLLGMVAALVVDIPVTVHLVAAVTQFRAVGRIVHIPAHTVQFTAVIHGHPATVTGLAIFFPVRHRPENMPVHQSAAHTVGTADMTVAAGGVTGGTFTVEGILEPGRTFIEGRITGALGHLGSFSPKIEMQAGAEILRQGTVTGTATRLGIGGRIGPEIAAVRRFHGSGIGITAMALGTADGTVVGIHFGKGTGAAQIDKNLFPGSNLLHGAASTATAATAASFFGRRQQLQCRIIGMTGDTGSGGQIPAILCLAVQPAGTTAQQGQQQ